MKRYKSYLYANKILYSSKTNEMKSLLSVIMILIASIVFSQERVEMDNTRANNGFFNITKISYIKAYELKRERFVPREGNIFSRPDASGTGISSLQTINGFFLTPDFSLGIGVGIESHSSPSFKTLPIFLDARLYFNDSANALFAFMNIGAGLKLGETSDFNRGGMFNLGGGYRFPISKKISLISEIYFSHRSISLTEEGLSKSNDIVRINGIGFSFGILF